MQPTQGKDIHLSWKGGVACEVCLGGSLRMTWADRSAGRLIRAGCVEVKLRNPISREKHFRSLKVQPFSDDSIVL